MCSIIPKLNESFCYLQTFVDYETTNQLEYMDMCIQETLRIIPPLVRYAYTVRLFVYNTNTKFVDSPAKPIKVPM